jgi:hypothetical protein
MTRTGTQTESHEVHGGFAARLLVVEPDAFARAVEALRADKRRPKPGAHRPPPVKPWQA